ncbi:MAG: NTP transferase domain-containing protein [Ignavibacteriaceae bacterium]|nr:NTP transferase domain-containing protein [Ignavibacteriaceae bacterium]
MFCAGNSSRMGKPKPLLQVKGISLIETCIANYRSACISNIKVIANESLFKDSEFSFTTGKFNVDVIVNSFPEKGRTYSIKLAAENSLSQEGCFFQNIDNPAPSGNAIVEMSKLLRNANDYIVPFVNGINGHPVLIGESILKHLASKRGLDWNLRDELRGFNRVYFKSDNENLIINLNTPLDWEKYKSSIDRV